MTSVEEGTQVADTAHGNHAVQAGDWLARFSRALTDGADLADLFLPACFWRDVLALTWRIDTLSDEQARVQLQDAAHKGGLRILGLSPGRTPPRRVTRAGEACIEALFDLETAQGSGCGVVRLCQDVDGQWKGWTLLTALQDLNGFEEALNGRRPQVSAESRDFRGPNWLDRRQADQGYADRDPSVIVVGGGQAGLAIAARLKQLGVDTLIVDRHGRIGDNWRLRYHALTLHNQVQVNHMPYMPFPPNWPTYIPKDKLANWFEAYVEAMELNYWTDTEFLGGTWDAATGQWTVQLRRDRVAREMRPRHVVLATGVSGIPNRPEIATLDRFKGPVLHSSQYQDGDDWSGKQAMVIGTGNSGHDISHDLRSSGAEVTLVQRGSSQVTQLDTAQLPYALYDEGPSTDDCDLIVLSTPTELSRRTHRALTVKAQDLDSELLDGLRARGFQLDFGADGTGWQFKYLTRGGGYYFNVGASDMIVAGEIGLTPFADIDHFTETGVALRDGTVRDLDLIVLATGYMPQEHLVERLFGREVATLVGPIWGFGDGEELRNMYCRTPQPGLWFIAGSLAQCRINSRYLALQIKAQEQGLLTA